MRLFQLGKPSAAVALSVSRFFTKQKALSGSLVRQRRWAHQQCYSTSNPVNTGIGDGPSSSRQSISVYNQPLRPTQPPTLSGTRNEYRPKFGDALQLDSAQVWLIPSVDKRGSQVKLHDPQFTCAIPDVFSLHSTTKCPAYYHFSQLGYIQHVRTFPDACIK